MDQRSSEWIDHVEDRHLDNQLMMLAMRRLVEQDSTAAGWPLGWRLHELDTGFDGHLPMCLLRRANRALP